MVEGVLVMMKFGWMGGWVVIKLSGGLAGGWCMPIYSIV